MDKAYLQIAGAAAAGVSGLAIYNALRRCEGETTTETIFRRAASWSVAIASRGASIIIFKIHPLEVPDKATIIISLGLIFTRRPSAPSTPSERVIVPLRNIPPVQRVIPTRVREIGLVADDLGRWGGRTRTGLFFQIVGMIIAALPNDW